MGWGVVVVVGGGVRCVGEVWMHDCLHEVSATRCRDRRWLAGYREREFAGA